MIRLTCSLAALTASLAAGWQTPALAGDAIKPPTTREVLSVPRVTSASVSPDGRAVVYAVTRADWAENRYDTELFMSQAGAMTQLTEHEGGSSWGQSWSPDGERLAFLRSDDGAQIFVMPGEGGPARQLTKISGGISAFAWSPDGKHMALLVTERPTATQRTREENFGRFSVEGTDPRHQHLWLLNVEGASDDSAPVSQFQEGGSGHLRRLTGGDYTVGSFFGGGFRFTPDGKELLFDHADHRGPEALHTQDISAVDIATGAVRPIVRAPGIDSDPHPSPDGKNIAFHRAPGPDFWYHRQYHVATAPMGGGEPQMITEDMAEEASLLGWYPTGILFRRHRGVETHVHRIDADTRETEQLTSAAPRVHHASVSADGRMIAFVGEGPETAREVYLRTPEGERRLTQFTDSTAHWPDHQTRLIRWKTVDGTEIEGVLYLPHGHKGEKDAPRPLIVLLHGGPAVAYRPSRVHQDVYPVNHWLDQGALVLAPNYRGSGGYGDAFMAANIRRLGAAYAEDVLTGVETLVAAGLADPDRLGAAGWSAGGDAAAYIATGTDRFAAVSVGAGISDLTLDYASNDQPRKLREYMQATPWSDPAAYRLLSPLSRATSAKTPTLIQHGRGDSRVDLVNATALYRALRDQGVPVQLVVYDDAGHVIYKPKDRLAANEHNRIWFDAYLWGDRQLPDLTLEGLRP